MPTLGKTVAAEIKRPIRDGSFRYRRTDAPLAGTAPHVASGSMKTRALPVPVALMMIDVLRRAHFPERDTIPRGAAREAESEHA